MIHTKILKSPLKECSHIFFIQNKSFNLRSSNSILVYLLQTSFVYLINSSRINQSDVSTYRQIAHFVLNSWCGESTYLGV